MSKIYTSHSKSISAKTSTTAQTAVISGREADMAKNNAGGVSFKLSQWDVLDRFLVLGTESNGYYVGAAQQTADSFTTVISCVKEDGARVIARIMEYSLSGRAPKNDPAVVALALAAVYGNADTVQLAYDTLPKIARTGTWLFQFVSILNSLGKWNAAAKRGVAKWYTGRDIEKLTVQMLKYQQRNGWAHRDVLRLAHVKPTSELMSNLFRYSINGANSIELGAMMPSLVIDFEMLKRTEDKKQVMRIIADNDAITWEMVPTKWLADADVLMLLVKNMGLTAVIRKLGVLTARGVITPLSEGTKMVINKLSDMEALKRQRVHPITILQAVKQYSKGSGEKGTMTWQPDQSVVAALDDSFYAAFSTVEKTDDAYFLGIDCSGSMWGCNVNGSPNLNAAEVAGVMAMAIIKNQPNYWVGGFNSKMGNLKITPNMRLNDVLNVMSKFSWGSTDCALPFLTASQGNMVVDRFVTITDNETWSGRVHPAEALRDYRKKMNPGAKSVVIGTSVSSFTIADPEDAGSLDIAGFDSSAPQIIAQF